MQQKTDKIKYKEGFKILNSFCVRYPIYDFLTEIIMQSG